MKCFVNIYKLTEKYLQGVPHASGRGEKEILHAISQRAPISPNALILKYYDIQIIKT